MAKLSSVSPALLAKADSITAKAQAILGTRHYVRMYRNAADGKVRIKFYGARLDRTDVAGANKLKRLGFKLHTGGSQQSLVAYVA